MDFALEGQGMERGQLRVMVPMSTDGAPGHTVSYHTLEREGTNLVSPKDLPSPEQERSHHRAHERRADAKKAQQIKD